MSTPFPGEPEPEGRPFWRPITVSIAGIVLTLLLVFGGLYVASRYGVQPFVAKVDTPATATESKLALQTEVFFLNGLKSQPVVADEWWSARSDHRLLAYAVFNCKRLTDVVLDAMPRQYFTSLLLDLTPSGNHAFATMDGEGSVLATRDKEKGDKPLVLTSSDQDILSLSDSIARSRLAAADGANSNVPWVQRLGLTTLIISALATLFVTLQGKTRAVELTDDEKKDLDRSSAAARFGHAVAGPGSGFRWVAFLAIALSITGTSLTGLKQVYDPTRILTQNTRALLDLRQLHQEVILSVKCDTRESRVSPDQNRMSDWTAAIRRARATIIPEYGAYANLDVGGTAQRVEAPQGRVQSSSPPREEREGPASPAPDATPSQ